MPFSSGFANASYNGLDAFRLVNAAGASTPVRWSMAAVDPFEPESPAQSAAQDKNYLFDAVIARIVHAPVKWRLVVTIGEPADPTDEDVTVEVHEGLASDVLVEVSALGDGRHQTGELRLGGMEDLAGEEISRNRAW